jgi:hypothetical protein
MNNIKTSKPLLNIKSLLEKIFKYHNHFYWREGGFLKNWATVTISSVMGGGGQEATTRLRNI